MSSGSHRCSKLMRLKGRIPPGMTAVNNDTLSFFMAELFHILQADSFYGETFKNMFRFVPLLPY